MTTAQLKAKITARNAVNAAIMKYAPAMRLALNPFVGKPITTKGGALLQKVQFTLPNTPPFTPDLHCYYTTGHGYSLRACFRASCQVVGEAGTMYAEADAYLGDIENGVLKAVYPNAVYRTDYTVEEALRLRRELVVAEDRVSNIRNQLAFIL